MKFTFLCKALYTGALFFSVTLVHAQTPVSGVEYLGKGYDVFGNYADPASVKERLLSISDADYISVNKISVKTVEHNSGSSIAELSKSYSNKFSFGVNAFYFKGGLETEFSGLSTSTEKMFYSSINDISSQYQIKYDIEPKTEMALLRKLVTGRAKQRLNSPDVDPKTLFEIYGTHYLFNIVVGGSARYNTVTKTSNSYNEQSIKAAVDAEYKIFSGKASRELTTSERNIVGQTTRKLYAVGGNSEYLNNINDKQAYNKWVSGIASNSVLCGLTDPNSLRPIWELCDSPERRKQIETYYKEVHIKQFPLPYSDANLKKGVLNTAFITQVFDGNFSGSSDGEFLTMNVKDGVNLHYGKNLDKVVNLISINTIIDGVQFSMDKEAKIIGVDYYTGSKLSFAIGDVNGNLAIYRVIKEGDSYRAQLRDKSSQTYEAMTLKGGNKRLLVLQKGPSTLVGIDFSNTDAEPVVRDFAGELAKLGGSYISSIARLGDVNGDGMEDLYCVSQKGHFIVTLSGGKFTVLQWFREGQQVGTAFQVGANDRVLSIGNVDNNAKKDIMLTNGHQYTVLHPGNQTVVLGASYIASTTFANLNLHETAEIIGITDLEQDGKSELFFATDYGSYRKYQVIDLFNKKEKSAKSVKY